MTMLRHLFLFLAMTAVAQSGFSWGQTGHRAVAEICMRHLSPAAQKEIKTLLGKDYLTELSTWPDYIKSEPAWNFAKRWHYINVDPDQTLDQVMADAANDPEINNVVEALNLMEAVLSNKEKETAEFAALLKQNGVEPLKGSIRITALAFFIHFMGDLHQPLHVGMRKDLGGNKVKVRFFRQPQNLHSVWDSGIIDQEQLSFTELADYANDASDEELKVLRSGNYGSWAYESLEHRLAIYAQFESLKASSEEDDDDDEESKNEGKNPTKKTRSIALSYDYQHDFMPLMESQIEAAGVRSAMLLNRIFQ